MTVIRLPDGTERSFDQPVTVLDVALSIGSGLARAALAGKVNGKLVDVTSYVEDNSELRVVNHKSYLELKGSLKSIFAYALNSHIDQINIPDELNKSYEMRFKLNSHAYFDKAKTILKKLRLKKSEAEIQGEVLVFDIQNPRFWGSDHINWGPDTPSFLIGDSEFKADDVSLEEVKYKLINLLDTPIVINHEDIDVKLTHDWDIASALY